MSTPESAHSEPTDPRLDLFDLISPEKERQLLKNNPYLFFVGIHKFSGAENGIAHCATRDPKLFSADVLVDHLMDVPPNDVVGVFDASKMTCQFDPLYVREVLEQHIGDLPHQLERLRAKLPKLPDEGPRPQKGRSSGKSKYTRKKGKRK